MGGELPPGQQAPALSLLRRRRRAQPVACGDEGQGAAPWDVDVADTGSAAAGTGASDPG